ncbi:MAG: hypothetical protein M3Z85_22960 [Acidobacteriota bacterium]|nr:hypothetical protein [Acidobacteriota bacterium]
MFLFFAFLIFSAALFGTAWYIWSVPQQEDSRVLAGRLRELRTQSRSKSKQAPDLLRREKRGNFAVLGDVANWIGILRRLQQWIQQADLKYRAADVFALSLALAIGSFFLMGIFGVHLFLLRLLFAGILGYAPIFYIRRMRARRLKKFEENLPDAIDLFTRTMRAGHNIHSGL